MSKSLNTNIISISQYRYPLPFANGLGNPRTPYPTNFSQWFFNNCPHCAVSSSFDASRWESGALSQSALASLSTTLAQNVWSVSSAQSFGRRACSKAHGKGKAKITSGETRRSEIERDERHRLSINDNSELITLVIATKTKKTKRSERRATTRACVCFYSCFALHFVIKYAVQVE